MWCRLVHDSTQTCVTLLCFLNTRIIRDCLLSGFTFVYTYRIRDVTVAYSVQVSSRRTSAYSREMWTFDVSCRLFQRHLSLRYNMDDFPLSPLCPSHPPPLPFRGGVHAILPVVVVWLSVVLHCPAVTD